MNNTPRTDEFVFRRAQTGENVSGHSQAFMWQLERAGDALADAILRGAIPLIERLAGHMEKSSDRMTCDKTVDELRAALAQHEALKGGAK